MTTIDTERMARGWGLIAEGAMELSLAYSAIEQRSLGTADSDLPPLPPLEDPDDVPPLKPQVDAGLGKCPIHGKPWTIKAAGVSKAGKPYSAFYKCAERDADGYCKEKPQPIWVQTHPIREGAAA